jgi:SLT domain-containing protein
MARLSIRLLHAQGLADRGAHTGQMVSDPGYVPVGANQDPTILMPEQPAKRAAGVPILVRADADDIAYREFMPVRFISGTIKLCHT